MALWNRNNKPQNDHTKSQASIIGVDHTSISGERGVQSAGWVYKRLIGQNRVTYETLVAMKTPPPAGGGTPAFDHWSVSPATVTPLAGDTVLVTAQARDQFGNPFPGVRTANWSATSGSFSVSSTTTDSSGLTTNTLQTLSFPDDLEVVHVTDGSGHNGSSPLITTQPNSGGGGGNDPLIQSVVNGAYNGKPVKLYGTATGFPNPSGDRLIGTWTVSGPGTVVSTTEVILNLVSNDATLTNSSESPSGEDKYLVIDPLGTTPIFLSVGASGNDFDARVVVSSMDMFGGDVLTLPEIHIKALTNLHHYNVTRSPSSGISAGSSYTVTAQAKDSGNTDVHVIGRSITASYVAVSGAGSNGSVSGTPAVSNKYGTFQPIAATAGLFPKTEEIHVADSSGIIGDTTNLVVGDVVNGYAVSSVDDAPGPGSTKTITARAQLNGTDTAVAGRVITWSKTSLVGATFSSPTSTTDSSGHATVDVTFGSVGSAGTVTATDAQGQTGTSENITVSTSPPTFFALTNGSIGAAGSGSPIAQGTSIDLPSVTVPANATLIFALGHLWDTSAIVPTASGLTFSLVNGISQTFESSFSDTINVWTADVGSGGFTGGIHLAGAGDGILSGGFMVGYVLKSEALAVAQSIGANFSPGTATAKTLAFASTPATTSLLLAFWSQGIAGGGAVGSWTPKGTWTEVSDDYGKAGGSGYQAGLEVQKFAGSDVNSQATPTNGDPGVPWYQQALILEISHT